MRILVPAVFFIAVAIMSAPVQASDIKSRHIDYNYDDLAHDSGGNGYLICDDCRDDRLVQESVSLTISFSRPLDERNEGHSVVLPVGNSSISAITETHAIQTKPMDQPHVVTVKFALNSSVVSQKERLRLLPSIQSLKRREIKVVGYTCTLGNTEYNQKLSRDRAKAITNLLESEGIKVTSFEGKGKCCPVSDDKSKNRRVEINSKAKEPNRVGQ